MNFHHQSGAKVNAEKSKIIFFFGDNLNYIQVGNSHLEFDIRNRKHDNTNLIVAKDNTNEVFRLVNNVFAYTIHDSRISTSTRCENELNKFVGPVSTIMRLISQRHGDLSTDFDVTDESEAAIKDTCLKQKLINNHAEANSELIRGHLPLE